jgi:hypothetical protein
MGCLVTKLTSSILSSCFKIRQTIKSVGRSLPASPLPPQARTMPATAQGDQTMTRTQYLTALKRLGLRPASKKTAEALGVSVRQLMRYNAGAEIPPMLVKLLEALLAKPRHIS